MYGTRKITAVPAAVLLLTTLLATTSVAQSDKVGGISDPTTLDLIAQDVAVDWSTDLFMQKVDELSDGALRVRQVDSPPEGDIAVLVRDGQADLGEMFVREMDQPTRAFRALTAPFVVNDIALEKAVVTGPIGEDMLAALEDDGLVGLTIVPGDGRFVIGRSRPFVSLADFQGAVINVPPTRANNAAVRALGAEPSNMDFGGDQSVLDADSVDAIVTPIGGGLPGSFLTANLEFHTVPVAWFVNPQTMASLTPAQQQVLRDAAQAVQEVKLEELSDIQSSVPFCASGGTVVMASDAELSAIENAVQPVLEGLREDPLTAEFLDRIEALQAETARAPYPALCGSAAPAAGATAIPDGKYVAELSRADALRLGAYDECTLKDVGKLAAMVIDGERWTEMQRCGTDAWKVGSSGTLEYDGDHVMLVEDFAGEGSLFAWSADGDSLSLSLVETPWPEDEPILHLLFDHTFAREE